MTPAITFNSVHKRYPRTEAVRGLSLEVPAGKVTAYLGPNGAGKTTTIKMLLGLVEQTSGSIDVLGTDSRELRPVDFQRIAYVSENQKLPLGMKVRQFLDFCRPLYNKWDAELEARLLRQLNIPLEAKLGQLSRGQLMKASLLSNLAYRPDLVVLDEPFSGLDPLVRDEFVHSLLEFTEQEGWTVFISSHDIEEVQRLTDHVAIIDKGGMKLSESTDDLLERFQRVSVPVGEGVDISQVPKTWLHAQMSGRILHFTHSQWQGGNALADELRTHLGDTGQPTIQPLTLREIFVSLAREYRIGAL